MKRLMIHSVFAAAAMAAVIGSASAQVLVAEVPFAFRAGSVGMSAGTYVVALDHGVASAIVRIENRETHARAILLNYAGHDPSKAWVSAGEPKLAFECAGSRCALRDLWTGQGPALRITPSKHEAGEPVHLTEIRLTRAPAL